MEEIAFFPLSPGDIEEIMAIENSSFSTPWTIGMFKEELSNKERSFFTVAKINGKIVGYGGFWLVLDEMHLGNIAVHPGYRRRGIGKKILKELIATGVSKGAKMMTLEVRETNAAAKTLYEKMEFRMIAIRKQYYADTGENAYVYMKDKL